MPFTHPYSSSGVAASPNYNRRGHIPSSSSSSSSFDANSLRQSASSRSATTVDSPSPSEHDSTRSRLFSSGRKSPDPFRRFRRLSSSISLNIATAPPALDAGQSFDSQQQQQQQQQHKQLHDYYSDTRIPPSPSSSNTRPPASPAPLETPRSAPPPLPSPSTKPVFQRPKRTKSSSISILSTGLGLRSRENLNPPSTSHTRRRHRKSASLSGSDVDFSSSTIDSPRAATPQPMLRPASPSPSLSESIYSIHQDTAAARSAPAPPTSAAYTTKQHKQAWYQAQQKTIELENPYNRGAQHSDSDNAKLFPLNITTTSRPAVLDNGDRGRSSPADSRSPHPVVETFLSEEEMLAAGIHIIRRRDDRATTTLASSKGLPGSATPRVHEQATVPALPPRLYGADHPDFLEFIDSPITSKQPSPLLEQLVEPPTSSASMQRALSHSYNKSSSGSLSMSSSSSNDYLPHSAGQHDDASSLHNGSTGSLSQSSSSKHSFSFAKLRRAGAKQGNNGNVGGSSRPSTANSSSNEDVSSNRTFLFPPRGQQSIQQQQQQQQQQLQQLSSSTGAAVPGYLSPGPASSASPFLNKYSATVGRASGSVGAGHTAKNGLAQVFNGSGSSAATVGPSSSASNPYAISSSNGVPPPKPPKPKPSLLAAFPRSGNNSILGSISAPNTAREDSRYDVDRNDMNSRNMLRPPSSAGIAGSNGIYHNIAHSRSQEAVAEARLDAEALRASAGTPLPPPRRLNAPRGGYGGAAGGGGLSGYSAYSSAAMGRSTSGGGGGVVGALGHVGQFGAAMGRKGWDFMKTLQSSNNTTATSGRGGPYTPSYRAGVGAGTAAAAENEPTRQWLMLLEGPDAGRSVAGGVFGAPLKDVVLRSRLSSIASDTPSNEDHLGVPDLGKDFSANFLESPRVTPRASVAGAAAGEPLSREEARHLFLPRIVVRCIESLEKWGPSEEGIYRISGRSSHTAKLRAFFSDPRNDLRLDEINPADLDINSVCSLLKSYLRELPDTLIPLTQSKALDQAVARLFADTESSPPEAGGGSGGKVTDARVAQISAERVAEELSPLMRQLPVYNWYLLRELTHHLGLLAQSDVVARTKMPISNLTLVLAPTVSISLPLLQLLVRHREVVFAGPVPSEDVVAVVAAAAAAVVAASLPPPKPAKPEKLSSPASRLPVMVRKRASSMGLGALLSSPTSKTAAEKSSKSQHRRTSSTTPSLELPAGIGGGGGGGGGSGPSSPAFTPPSPSIADEPYERPSTSLGHFAESPSRPSPSTNHRRFGSRDAALRFNALALDDAERTSTTSTKTLQVGGEETPIARYYARIREEAERAAIASVNVDEEEERDGAKTPLASPNPLAPPSISCAATGGEMHRYWAEKTSLLSHNPNPVATGRSGRTSALDRPRPPTSSSASFFSGRSRRQDSVNGLVAFAKPSSSASSIPTLVSPTKPLKIVKKSCSHHSASDSADSATSWNGDADKPPRLGVDNDNQEEEEEEEEEEKVVGLESTDRRIRRYLAVGPGRG